MFKTLLRYLIWGLPLQAFATTELSTLPYDASAGALCLPDATISVLLCTLGRAAQQRATKIGRIAWRSDPSAGSKTFLYHVQVAPQRV